MAELPGTVRSEVVELLDSLEEEPTQFNADRLRRNNKYFRIYVGGLSYRIVFRLNDHKREVFITRIRPRKTAYEGLRNP